nr:DUF2934 domain-containing protein [candidate division Zixibacteria bacterium]
MVETDDHGFDARLKVKTKDGTEATIDLNGGVSTNQGRQLVEKVAYSLYERRGYTNGNDLGDWLEAEHKVREAEDMFV